MFRKLRKIAQKRKELRDIALETLENAMIMCLKRGTEVPDDHI